VVKGSSVPCGVSWRGNDYLEVENEVFEFALNNLYGYVSPPENILAGSAGHRRRTDVTALSHAITLTPLKAC